MEDTAADATARAAAMAAASAVSAAAAAARHEGSTSVRLVPIVGTAPEGPSLAPAHDGASCSESPALTLLSLPPELAAMALLRLPLPQICRSQAVCRAFKALAAGAAAMLGELRLADLMHDKQVTGAVAFLSRSSCRSRALAALTATERSVSGVCLSAVLRGCGGCVERIEMVSGALGEGCCLGVLAPRLSGDAAEAVSDQHAPCPRCDRAWCGPDGREALGAQRARLHTVVLPGCALLGDSLHALGELPMLRVLDVSSCPRLSHLDDVARGCGALETLNVAFTRFSNAALCAIAAGCPLLRELNLMSTRVSDAGLGVAPLPSLQVLSVANTAVGSGGLANIAQRSHGLRRLDCTRCANVGDDGAIIVVVKCRSLSSLTLARSSVTNSTMLALGALCESLEELHIAGCDEVGDEGVIALAGGCPYADTRANASNASPGPLAVRSPPPRPARPSAASFALSAPHPQRGALAVRRRLGAIFIDCCSGVSDVSIVRLAEVSPQLSRFQSIGCCGIGDKSLSALARHCRGLRRIDVRGCTNVSEVGLEACARLLPACKVHANSVAVQIS